MVKSKTCWIITNGNAGTLNQALGLAEQMGLEPEIKTMQRRFPFSLIPPIFKTVGQLSTKFTTKHSSTLSAPWPDIVIACGAQSVHFCLYVRKQSKGKSFCIYLQDPKISPNHFDLIIKMEHDSIQGDNVIESKLSLNRITPEKLKQESKKYLNLFKEYHGPFITFLIGGSTKRYKMTKEACEDILEKVNIVLNNNPKATLLITPSRRTPKYLLDLLNKNLTQNKRVYIHNLDAKINPYFAMLAKADEIFVTNDSVNMISEACSTGKKIHIIKLLGFTKGKPIQFSNNIIKNKLATFFDGQISKKTPTPSKINETKKIAQQVQKILMEKHNFSKKDFKSN